MSRSQIRAGRGQVPDLLPVALAFLTVLGACGSTGGRQRTPAGHVLTLLVQPDGVWREDSLGTREGPLEEAVYVSEFASLHVLLEGGEERELTASLAVVRVTREGRPCLEERLVAEGVRGVRVTEEGADAAGGNEAAEGTAEWALVALGLLAGTVLLGLLYLGGGEVGFHNPWGPD